MGIPDVDFDVADRGAVDKLFSQARTASQMDPEGLNLKKHNTGVYFQNPPVDPLSGLVTFPYDLAEELEFYKIDFIPFAIYKHIRDEEHLRSLVNHAESGDFDWDWFLEDGFFEGDTKVTHLGNYAELCRTYPPESVMDVAILIALIRPRKKYLIGEHWDDIEKVIWENLEDEEGYFFKKSHAVGYALAVLVHMQIISEINTDA